MTPRVMSRSVFTLYSSPHRAALLSSGQQSLHRGSDVGLLHHSSLTETGRRQQSTTKGAGINHLAFVIIIQNGYRLKLKIEKH